MLPMIVLLAVVVGLVVIAADFVKSVQRSFSGCDAVLSGSNLMH